MNFEELGLTLQREREKKGLSIEVVMEATKISRTNLVAMEGGDRSALPHPVYAKGFVRSYARYLGLDADELCMVVDREFQDQSEDVADPGYEVSPAAEKAFQEKDGSEGHKKKRAWPLLLLLVVAIGIAAFVFLGLKGKDVSVKTQPGPIAEQAETAPSAPDTAQEPAEASGEAEADAPDKAVDASESQEGASDGEKASNSEEAEEAAEPAVTPPPAVEKKAEPVAVPAEADQAEKTADQPEKQKYDHILIIRATTEKGCWVGVWKEDETKMARDFVLKQGEPLRLMFNLPRRVRIGNASGVTVSYNGKPYSLDLNRGNIQTLTFGFE